jgi:hypothetical protein
MTNEQDYINNAYIDHDGLYYLLDANCNRIYLELV